MKIVADGRKAGNGNEACYDYGSCTAYFKRKGLHKSNVLHEFYHHIAYVEGWEISKKREEREAERYAKKMLNLSLHPWFVLNGYFKLPRKGNVRVTGTNLPTDILICNENYCIFVMSIAS